MVTISKQEFDSSLRQFISISKQTADPWKEVKAASDPDYIYGSLSVARVVKSTITDDSDDNLDELNDLLNDEDNLQLAVSPNHDKLVQFNYHIIYNESYSVPVLYFQGSYSNGSHLKVQEIWNSIPTVYMDNISLPNDSQDEHLQSLLSIVSQTEHPYLGTPFYQIHPCQTSTLIQNAISRKEPREAGNINSQQFNIIITWLSSIAPLVGLKLDPYYARALQATTPNQE